MTYVVFYLAWISKGKVQRREAYRGRDLRIIDETCARLVGESLACWISVEKETA